jgi:hypothetical protein
MRLPKQEMKIVSRQRQNPRGEKPEFQNGDGGLTAHRISMLKRKTGTRLSGTSKIAKNYASVNSIEQEREGIRSKT